MNTHLGRATSLLRRHHQTLAGIADQGVIGIGNLAVGLLVLRSSAKVDYGLYSLFYTTLIVLNGFANALLVSQLTVSYHRRSDRDAFASAMLCGQMVLGAGLAVSGISAAVLLPGTMLSPAARAMLAVSALSCPVVLVQDFLRGYFFLLRKNVTALGLDTLLVAGWISGTLLGMATGASPALAALAAYGAAALLAGGVGVARSGLPLRLGPSGLRRASIEAWDQGRWAVGGAIVTALQNQAHIYILAWIASTRALAELNAARMLMMPAGILILGVGRTLLPAMARLAAESRVAEMRRVANRALCAIIAVVVLYSLAIGLGHDVVIGHVLGRGYADVGRLVGLWMLVMVLQAVDANFSIVLQVTGRFRVLTLVNLWTVGPVLLVAIPMIRHFGPEGNLLTLAGGYGAMALLLLVHSRRALAGILSVARGPTPPGEVRLDAEPALNMGKP